MILNKGYNWQYMSVVKRCPLDVHSRYQRYSEINNANDELAGVKVTINDAEESVLLISETNLELIDCDKYGVAVQLSLMTLLNAIKKLKAEKIIKGLSGFLKVVK